jgi:hypothetical protein
MVTSTKSRKSVKPDRRVYVVRGGNRTTLSLSINGEETLYYLEPISSDFGNAFRLTKVKGEWDGLRRLDEPYDVLLNGRESSCTCKGHTYRGRCKHVDGLTTLRQRNLI